MLSVTPFNSDVSWSSRYHFGSGHASNWYPPGRWLVEHIQFIRSLLLLVWLAQLEVPAPIAFGRKLLELHLVRERLRKMCRSLCILRFSQGLLCQSTSVVALMSLANEPL